MTLNPSVQDFFSLCDSGRGVLLRNTAPTDARTHGPLLREPITGAEVEGNQLAPSFRSQWTARSHVRNIRFPTSQLHQRSRPARSACLCSEAQISPFSERTSSFFCIYFCQSHFSLRFIDHDPALSASNLIRIRSSLPSSIYTNAPACYARWSRFLELLEEHAFGSWDPI